MDRKMHKRIAILNLVMACIIAIYHFGNAALDPLSATDAKASDLVSAGIELLAYFAMNWFFLVTGFLLFKNYTPEQYFSKLKRRFLTVFVPYLFWQLAFTLMSFPAGATDIPELIRTIFLLKIDPPDGPLWYMCAIFYLAVLSPLFYPLLKSRITGAVTVFLVLFGSYYLTVTKVPVLEAIGQYGRVHNTLYYLGSYLIGLWLGLHHTGSRFKDLLPFFAALVLFGLAGDLVLDGFLPLILKKLVPLMLLYLFPIREKEKVPLLASGSFLIYALHAATKWGRITRIRRIFLLPICRSAWFLNLFCRLGALVFTIGVAAVLWIGCSLFCPLALRLFTGGRVPPLTKPIWHYLRKNDNA